MKKLSFSIVILALASLIYSCKKLDNYEAPAETLTGQIIDASTGEPIQTQVGDTRLTAYEISWSNNPTPNYFNVKADGTFNNSKVFKGTYRIYPSDGPFVPLVYTDASGGAVDTGSDTVAVAGIKELTFTVSPYLKVEWVGEPVLNPDSTLTVQCRFTRGTDIPERIFNVTDVYLFVSTTEFVGNGSFDNKLSTQINYSGADGNAFLGQTVTITTKAKLGTERAYFVRVGARTSDNVNRRYNYNAPKHVTVP